MTRSSVAFAFCAFFVAACGRAEAQGTWTPTSLAGAPSARCSHRAVWTGTRMIVWGGDTGGGAALDTGGLYDPGAGSWTPTSTSGAPLARFDHSALWTGSRMIVWGGRAVSGATNTGALYDPATDSWTPMTTAGAPSGRYRHAAVWTGSRLIVWGGTDGATAVNTGGSYDPATDSWTAISSAGAPSARYWHVAVWTGSKMLVWGGAGPGVLDTTNTGGAYDPVADTWTPTATAGAPAGRISATAVWTGSRMIVWGGGGYEATGGVYDPAADTWSATSLAGAAPGRTYHAAAWTGSRMVVWGGAGWSLAPMNTGGAYDPGGDAWTAIVTGGAPIPRFFHSAVWTGSSLIVWGGRESGSSLVVTQTGGSYADPSLLSPARFFPVTPCRVADTRRSPGPSGGPALAANGSRTFPVSGLCGIPAAATAVALNVTVVDESEGGDLRVYPSGATMPLASTVNFSAGKVRANNAVIPLGAGGQITVQCDMAAGSTGVTHLVLDATGYFE